MKTPIKLQNGAIVDMDKISYISKVRAGLSTICFDVIIGNQKTTLFYDADSDARFDHERIERSIFNPKND